VAEGVAGCRFGEVRGADGLVEGTLQDRFVEVVAAALARCGVAVVPRRGKDPLPGPVLRGVRVLDAKGIGELHVASAKRKVTLVLFANGLKVVVKHRPELNWKEGDAVFSALGVTYDQVAGAEVDVLDPQARTLEQAKTGAVQELRHEEGNAAHLAEHAPHLVTREHERETVRARRAREIVDPRRRRSQRVPVQEGDRTERLNVSGRTDTALARQAFEEGANVVRSELGRVPAMEDYEAPDPSTVGSARPHAQVLECERLLDLIS
jgi:hypothetical protein